MKRKIIILSLFTFTLLPLSSNLFAQPPQYVKYVLTVTISGQVINVTPGSSNIVSGAEIRVSIRYDEYFAESGNFENKYESRTLYTNSQGYYYAAFDISAEINYMTLGMDAKFIGPSDWLLRDEKLGQDMSDTEYVKNFNVVALADSDGNGIHDYFEWELLKKFCPSFRTNVSDPYLFPNPVQILGGEYNTKISVTMTIDNKFKHEFYDKENVVPIRADLVEYAGPDLKFSKIMKYDTWGKPVDITNNEILHLPSNPIPIYWNDYLRIKKNSNASYETISVADIIKKYMPNHYPFVPAALYVHYDLPGSTPSDWYIDYRDDPLKSNYTVYGTIWKEGNIIAIQYWFFYAYNDWKNDHEGDWEHINVIITSQFPEQAEIDKVQFYFHTKWKEWEPEYLRIEDNTHVMVYIGGSYTGGSYTGHLSNGSYPFPDMWENAGHEGDHDDVHSWGRELKWYFITDNSDKPDDGYGLELIKDTNYLVIDKFFTRDNGKNRHYNWLIKDIFWGEPGITPDNKIARYSGPTFKAGWRAIGSSPNGYSPY